MILSLCANNCLPEGDKAKSYLLKCSYYGNNKKDCLLMFFVKVLVLTVDMVQIWQNPFRQRAKVF
jgi:hypothetical protein